LFIFKLEKQKHINFHEKRTMNKEKRGFIKKFIISE